uniref:Uncharacterized protein n=1 Tax=Dunaliella tertiolecta TaxID=3047 RepID=A0A7S3R385_DUNTE
MWVVLLALLLQLSRAYQGEQPHPYNPHDPPWSVLNASFFQGWYMRVTGEQQSSLAVILGQYIPPPGSNPGVGPVMCMVMQQPAYEIQKAPPPPRSVTQYFDDIFIERGDATKLNSNTRSSSSSSSNGAVRCRCPPSDSDISHPLAPPHFSAETAQAVAMEPAGHGQAAAGQGAVCRLSVSPAGFEVNAHIPGSVSVSIRSQEAIQESSSSNSSSSSSRNPGFCILPWSRDSAIAEGWAQYLGPLIGVHYSLLSMRTPVTVSGAWTEDAHGKIHSSRGVVTVAGTSVHRKAAEMGKGSEMLASSKAKLILNGPGLLHTEAQWGSGFPHKWIWAEGQQFINHDPSMADPFCGGDAGGITFVMAGGDLAHALSPPLPQLHLFLFSYRDSKTGASVSVDPSNPALVTSEDIDACSGTVAITLTSFSHVIKVGPLGLHCCNRDNQGERNCIALQSWLPYHYGKLFAIYYRAHLFHVRFSSHSFKSTHSLHCSVKYIMHI